jgi:integrase/recombinase XerD
MNEFPQMITSEAQTSLIIYSDLPDLEHILAGQLAASSIAMYRRDVQAYLDYAALHNLSWLNAQTLVAWRDALALSSTMSPHTINRMLAAVKRIIREMASRHMIEDAMALQFDRVRGVQVKALKSRLKQHSRTRITPEDMRRMCEAPDRSTYVGMRDAALLATLASSGIRAAEASTLTLQQIHKRGRGYIIEVCGKTDTEYRDAHLSPEAYQLINAWIQARPVMSPYIFTSFTTRACKPVEGPISEVTVWNIVTRYAQACGLKWIKPHDFRRLVGTQLARDDIRKAQKALGHKSIEVTARHYVLDELEVGLTDNLY